MSAFGGAATESLRRDAIDVEFVAPADGDSLKRDGLDFIRCVTVDDAELGFAYAVRVEIERVAV